jgi:hypothetical protein
MATMNFSVPEDVKKQFMQQAIEERKREGRRKRAIDHLLALREQAPRVTDKEIRPARTQGRP